jgi:DNA-binding NtrC family response regulator
MEFATTAGVRRPSGDTVRKLGPGGDIRERLSMPSSARLNASALVVETARGDRERMVEWLVEAGYAARGAGSFEEARQILDAQAPEILISALRLGDFNGFHLLIRVRAAHPHVRAIITIPAPDPCAAAYAAELNASCLVAPVTQQALTAALRQMVPESPSA